jgi:hypothetical protein
VIIILSVFMLFGWVSLFWSVATAALVCSYVCCVPCLIGLVQLFREVPDDEA